MIETKDSRSAGVAERVRIVSLILSMSKDETRDACFDKLSMRLEF
jgi:hypothetical protein